MELQEAIERLRGYLSFCKSFKEVNILDIAIETVLNELDKQKEIKAEK